MPRVGTSVIVIRPLSITIRSTPSCLPPCSRCRRTDHGTPGATPVSRATDLPVANVNVLGDARQHITGVLRRGRGAGLARTGADEVPMLEATSSRIMCRVRMRHDTAWPATAGTPRDRLT